MSDLISKIVCQECEGLLQKSNDFLQCTRCKSKYTFQKKVLIMLSDISLEDKQNLFQKRFYDEHYKTEYANRDFEWKKRWVVRLINFLPKKHKNIYILDLACGQAYMTLAIAKKGYRVIACDISISGLVRARKEAERLGVEKNILFIACDVNTVRFKKNTFDFIVLLHVLEHLIHDTIIMKKVISFAKLNATYYIGVPLSLNYVFPLFAPLYIYSDKRVGHLRRYTIESILNLFTFSAEPVYTVYTGHLIKFFGLFLAKIGLNRWEKGIEDLDERMLLTKLWASNITTVIRRK